METRCPACGNTVEYCTTHFVMDTRHWRIVQAHETGKHNACSPHGCDEAFDRAVVALIESQQKEEAA
jgi:hypothetical protein